MVASRFHPTPDKAASLGARGMPSTPGRTGPGGGMTAALIAYALGRLALLRSGSPEGLQP
jgi:hypothetical protein